MLKTSGRMSRTSKWYCFGKRGPAVRRNRLSQLERLESRVVPAVYMVINRLDTNVGSNFEGTLRWCMNEANTVFGLDEIYFMQGLSSGNIKPATPLPLIIDPVIIDGQQLDLVSQDLTSRITIEGSIAGAGVTGLKIGSGGSSSVIRFLHITAFNGNGIELDGASNCSIESNFILGNGGSGVGLGVLLSRPAQQHHRRRVRR